MLGEGLHPHTTAAESPVYFLGIPTVLRASAATTGGAFGLVEHLALPPGFASPLHTHDLEDEWFYVLEGEVAFLRGDSWTRAGSGTFVFGPREIPHGFAILGNAPARMLLLCAPAGFEGFIAELSAAAPAPPDMARLAQVADKYKVSIHGPLPPVPDTLAGEARVPHPLEQLNRRWIQAFNDRDWATERTLLRPEFRAWLSGAAGPMDLSGWSGFIAAFTKGFPDARITIDECIASGNTVATRWHLTGTHEGEFQGIAPTGRAIALSGLEYNRVVDGGFAEHWSMFDNLALLRQIGAV